MFFLQDYKSNTRCDQIQETKRRNLSSKVDIIWLGFIFTPVQDKDIEQLRKEYEHFTHFL